MPPSYYIPYCTNVPRTLRVLVALFFDCLERSVQANESNLPHDATAEVFSRFSKQLVLTGEGSNLGCFSQWSLYIMIMS
jgi:hypothetical protein